ncbi:MAG: hypothetical protein GEU78_17390 [Actinobacteria bacterium]|nr:hypothetical protein [Actinomycetota bacterium]
MTRSTLAVQRRLPRVRVAPRAAESEGEDACFLASSYGLTPDDWQEDALDDWMGRRQDGRWAAATCGLAVPRQNGKNVTIEVRELYGMAVLGESFLHTAHEVKTARKAFLRIASFFENERQFPELAAMVREIRKTNGQEAVWLKNGGGVEFIARSRGSGRGFTVDVLVCDEAQDLTYEELAALLPTISAAPLGNPQVILTGTPPDPDRAQLAKGEVFCRVRADGEAKRDARLAWTDFGAADGPLPDVDDDDEVAAHNPALGIRLSMGEVRRERGLMSPATFARERMGWWGDPATDASVIDLAVWAGLADRSAESPESVSLVIDVAPDRAASTVGVAGPNGEQTLVLEHTQSGTAWVVPKVVELVAVRNVVEVALTPGQAESLVPDLVEAGVEFERLTTRQAGAACAAFQEAVKSGSVVHVGQKDLDTAVGNARTRYAGEVEVWDRREPRVNISPLVACSGAAYRWGLQDAPMPAIY